MTKKKIIEILITALIGAGIAFLQNLLSEYIKGIDFSNNPEVASGYSALIYWVRNFRA